jgi:thioredoxin reductase
MEGNELKYDVVIVGGPTGIACAIMRKTQANTYTLYTGLLREWLSHYSKK